MHFYRHQQTKLVTVIAMSIGRLPCHVREVDVERVAVGVWSGWNSSSFVLFLSLQHFPYGLFGRFYLFFPMGCIRFPQESALHSCRLGATIARWHYIASDQKHRLQILNIHPQEMCILSNTRLESNCQGRQTVCNAS